MKFGTAIIASALAICATVALAEEYTPERLIEIATASGVCGDGTVATAVLLDSGDISASCDEATAFIPLVGPAALGFLGLVLAATAGGDGTGSTGSTGSTTGG